MIIVFHLTYFINFPMYLTVINDWFGIGVQIFFLISGFSLFYGYFDHKNDPGWIKKYIIRRFLRIAPLFYIMIVFWSVLLFFNQGVLYSFGEYLLNFTLLFNLVPGVHISIVWAGWSIGVLFLFYLILPILIVAVRRLSVSLAVLVGSLFISSYYYDYISTLASFPESYGYMSIITQFPFFMMGIVCFFLIKKLLVNEELFEKRVIKVIGLGLVVFGIFIACILIWSTPTNIFLSQIPFIYSEYYAWGIVLVCLLIGLILYPWKGVVNSVSKFLGNRSYSVYLFHPFLVSLSVPVYNSIYGWIGDLSLSFLISFIYTLIMIVIISSLTYKFIEQPAIKYGSSFILKIYSGKNLN